MYKKIKIWYNTIIIQKGGYLMNTVEKEIPKHRKKKESSKSNAKKKTGSVAEQFYPEKKQSNR